MIQSMTGFAERGFASPTLRARVSIRSLNHRFFDWSYKGAPIGELENRLRALCQERLHRGRVEVGLDLAFPDPASWDVTINEGLLEKILASFSRVSSRLDAEIRFSIDSLFRIPQLVELRRKDLTPAEEAFLGTAFVRTIDDLVRARREEGRKTAAQLRLHLAALRKATARIEQRMRRQPEIVRRRLRRKLQDSGGGASLTKERMAEEVAFLAQRYDTAEEINRLKSHIDAAAALLASRDREPAGRMLDFLAQELSREANTLNAKSQDIGITKDGLLIKGEVESFRQQVQNLE